MNEHRPAMKPSDLYCAIGDDLRSLAVLHDREPSRELLSAMREISFPDNLGLQLRSDDAEKARKLIFDFYALSNENIDEETLDGLCVDYADIYLNHACRASPNESPWTDEDGLERQGSMFSVRQFYRNRGLGVQDWGERSDDHIVYQLQFIAHLMENGDDDSLREAVEFLDKHPLVWVAQFARQVVKHSHSVYYSGVALLTLAYLTELRELLGEVTSIPMSTIEPQDKSCD